MSKTITEKEIVKKFMREQKQRERHSKSLCKNSCVNYDPVLFPAPCSFRKTLCNDEGCCVKFVKRKK